MVSEMAVVFRVLPEAPVIVMVAVPIGAVTGANRVRRLVAVAGFVPKVALTPLGRPEAVRVTLPVKPFSGVMLIVVEPDPP